MITNKTRLNPDIVVNNETNINDKIPVCIDRSTSDPLAIDGSPGVYFSVVRGRKTSSFYIVIIDQKATKQVSFTILNPKVIKKHLCIFFYFLLSHYTYNI